MRGRVGVALAVTLASGCSIEASGETDQSTGVDTDATSTSSSTGRPEPATTTGTSAADTSTGGASSSTGRASSSSDDGVSSFTTTPPDDDSGPPPLGPACSVQAATQGDQFNPLPRGNAGEFPEPIAEVLEDYCGCHTLENNRQNIEWEFLRPPGNTLFLSLDDFSRSYGGSTLGQAMAEATLTEMPPASCPRPLNPLTVLNEWFAAGMPDAVEYEG